MNTYLAVAVPATPAVRTIRTAEKQSNHPFGSPVGYIPTRRPLDPNREYAWVNFRGNCMDSPDSPIRLKDGDKILIHRVPNGEQGIFEAHDKVVCFTHKGQFFCKHLVFAYTDPFNGFLQVRSYCPVATTYNIPLRDVQALFVVDDAMREEEVSNE